MEAEKLITVTGRGNIHILPDVTWYLSNGKKE